MEQCVGGCQEPVLGQQLLRKRASWQLRSCWRQHNCAASAAPARKWHEQYCRSTSAPHRVEEPLVQHLNRLRVRVHREPHLKRLARRLWGGRRTYVASMGMVAVRQWQLAVPRAEGYSAGFDLAKVNCSERSRNSTPAVRPNTSAARRPAPTHPHCLTATA